MSAKLYELAAEYRYLESLEASDDLPAEVIRDTIEGMVGDLEAKCTNVAFFIKNQEAVAQSIEQAAAKMQARAGVLRKRAESLQAYLQLNMQSCGISKIESPYFTLQLKSNPPAVFIDHEGSIPDKYWVQPDTPPKRIDKAAIAAAIKAGEEVPGAHTSKGERLEIKA